MLPMAQYMYFFFLVFILHLNLYFHFCDLYAFRSVSVKALTSSSVTFIPDVLRLGILKFKQKMRNQLMFCTTVMK